MNKSINIAVVGLGQVGSYLLNELNTKKKILNLKLARRLMLQLYQLKIINKKRQFKINKKYFLKIR